MGVVKGLDLKQCACCVGYIIEVDGKSYNISNENLPRNNLNLKNAIFPLAVELNFELNSTGCINEIGVIAIEKM